MKIISFTGTPSICDNLTDSKSYTAIDLVSDSEGGEDGEDSIDLTEIEIKEESRNNFV